MGEKVYSTSKAAQILDVSTATLKRWYKWYEDPLWDKPIGLRLPRYDTNSRGTRFFSLKDLQELEVFKQELQNGKYRGSMAEFNAYYQWGEKGSKILDLGKQYRKKIKEEYWDE